VADVVKPIRDKDDGSTLWVFSCPGCGYLHQFQAEGEGPTWHWNEDRESPTVTPSIHVLPGSEAQCHFYIEEGTIRFLNDCHHDLAGQTEELPEI